METFIESFQKKIASKGQSKTVTNSLPTIVSPSGSVHRDKRPSCVSIGPLHRGDPNLQKMEDHKWWLMHASRFQSVELKKMLENCFQGLKYREESARENYSVIVNMTSDEFVQMLFLDACFIIFRVKAQIEKQEQLSSEQQNPVEHQEMLSAAPNLLPRKSSAQLNPEENLEISPVHRILAGIRGGIRDHFRRMSQIKIEYPRISPVQLNLLEQDAKPKPLADRPSIGKQKLACYRLFDFDELILREIDIDLTTVDNQIPFFVLKYIWEWLVGCLQWESTPEFVWYFRAYFHVPDGMSLTTNIHHMLHFLHCSVVPESFVQCAIEGRNHWIPSAAELKEVGVEFRLKESPSSFLDIQFQYGTIYIPKIFITERQRLRLQNLVDFEQSVPGIKTHFTKFVRFMTCLLSKENDVRIISMQGIIENQLGSDKEVQLFFQNLHQRCSHWHTDTFLDEVFININKHKQSRRTRWKASFRRMYCDNPWVTLSVMGAIILFILTFLQSFFAVYSYFHPPS